jgi:(p)ppGpp synthase/HD superfamily hydrolase
VEHQSEPSARPAYSREFDEALALAAIVHRPAERKGTRVPYIVHPVHVASVLQRHGYRETVQIAALLHDVLEDVDASDAGVRASLEDAFAEFRPPRDGDGRAFRHAVAALIATRFSDRVRDLVEAMTQQKTAPDGSPIPIHERRHGTVEKVASSDDLDYVALKAADTLHNARSIAHDLRAKGLPMMARFKGSPVETVGYYVSVGAAVVGSLGAHHPLAAELLAGLQDLEAAFEGALKDGMEKLRSQTG